MSICSRLALGAAMVMVTLGSATSQAAVRVGVATPMQKVMIKGEHNGWPFESQYEGWLANSYNLALARNEHEAFQVVVIPDQALTNARVTASTLQPLNGQGAFDGEVKVWLVGHVKCSDQPRSDLNIMYPPYVVNYTGGWWPDPLLTFTNSCNIEANDRVSFWIDIATKSTTPPGDYTATVTVEADGIDPIPVQLAVKVWDIQLPAKPTLPTAFSIDSLWQAGWVYGNDWSDEIRNKFYQMHQAHRLSVTEIYSQPRAADFFLPFLDLNNAFCLAKVPTGNSLVDLYNLFNGLGRLAETYVYGYDEVTTDQFQAMHDTFTAIHQTYPGVKTMTTAYDSSFGTSPSTSMLRSAVDIWVPTIVNYNAAAANSLRAEGKDMWWYVADGPRHPYPNWYVEYPAIEARLLLGAMTFRYDAHGFLYYAVTNWGYSTGLPKNVPIMSGPYTSWNPSTAYSTGNNGWIDGDGSLYCAGPVNVGPLPTIRLENIRDGLEDYEYLHRLDTLVGLLGRCPSNDPQVQSFITSSQSLLNVPVVTNLTSYNRDPQQFYEFRRQVAEKIIVGQTLLAGTTVPDDTDGDGVGDWCDNCPFVANADQQDWNGDGTGDACDVDDDSDGIPDETDNCHWVPNADQADSDNDTIGNACDNCPSGANTDQQDTDGDGAGDVCDNCPTLANANQSDADTDSVGDVCDNCPAASNADQADDDEDGVGDVCDPTPQGGMRLDEEFDGMQAGAEKIGSWDQASLDARWPLTFGSTPGTFATGVGLDLAGAALNTKKVAYRMTANLEPDMTATYGTGNGGIGLHGTVNGTDQKPLYLEYTVDFRGEAFGNYSNFYVELSHDDGTGDQAPRLGMTTEDTDLTNGDQGPWRASNVHSAVAFGSFSCVNRAEGDVENAGGMGAPTYFDGLRWHYKTLRTIENGGVSLWKHRNGGLTTFKMVVKTNTVLLELFNHNEVAPYDHYGPYEVARAYLGGFNRVSMTMGNSLKSAAKYSFVDDVEVRNGLIAGDEDGDGVPDGVDLCLGTPACAVDHVQADGCPTDADSDGVFDGCDQCTQVVPACATIDANGCAHDTDKDGIFDGCDACPGTTSCARPVNDVGCPLDGDGDGVFDGCDQCPQSPTGSEVDPATGCPWGDSDGDGILDNLDACAGTPSCAVVNPSGCPQDEDMDNVLDGCDACPGTPRCARPVGADGCPFDSDGDKILDGCDACEDTPACATVNEFGCWSDNDKDQIPDGCDNCPADFEKIELGFCGCGALDIDKDFDGTPDCLDACPTDQNKSVPGQCGCGKLELDSDNDGLADCVDQCPSDPAKSVPGACGCGKVDTDANGNGIMDCNETTTGKPGTPDDGTDPDDDDPGTVTPPNNDDDDDDDGDNNGGDDDGDNDSGQDQPDVDDDENNTPPFCGFGSSLMLTLTGFAMLLMRRKRA